MIFFHFESNGERNWFAMILHRKQYNFANLLGKVLLFYFVSVVAINASILISTSPRRINFASQNGNETCSLHNFRCIYRWLLRHYFLFLFLSVRFVVVGLFAFGKLWPSVIMLNERIADSATHKMTDCCFLHFFFLCFSWIKFGYTISITDHWANALCNHFTSAQTLHIHYLYVSCAVLSCRRQIAPNLLMH